MLVPLYRVIAATLSVSLASNCSSALLEDTLLLGEWFHALACRHHTGVARTNTRRHVGTSTCLCCVIFCGTGTERSTTCVVGLSNWLCDTTDTSTILAMCWACATSTFSLHVLNRGDLSVRHDSPFLQRQDSLLTGCCTVRHARCHSSYSLASARQRQPSSGRGRRHFIGLVLHGNCDLCSNSGVRC